MINLHWIESYARIFGWDISIGTFNLWLLVTVAIGLDLAAINKNDIRQLKNKVRHLVSRIKPTSLKEAHL